jgi:hypothetical protein
MNGQGPRFGSLRAAPPADTVARGQSALRPARDTILSPRSPERPPAAAAPRAASMIFAAALMVATASLAAGLIRRATIYQLGGAEPFRFAGVVMPILAGVLALLVLSGHRIARSRALASLAVAAVLCMALVAHAGPGLSALLVTVASAIAFVALAIGLDWIGLGGAPGAARASLLVAAAQIGTILGEALAQNNGPPPLGFSVALIALVGPIALAAGYRRSETDPRPSLAATQALLGNYALLGLLAAAIAATAAAQLLGIALPFLALGDENAGFARGVMIAGTLIALLAGGFLADRFARDARGYAVWFAATLTLAGLATLWSGRLGLVAAGHAILLARLLPFAGIGAALALVMRLAPPPARLGGLIAFLAARAIGLAIVAPIIARGDSSLAYDAVGYGAFGLLLAAAAVYATMPKRNR